MKKIVFSILICSVFLGCSSGDNSEDAIPENKAPAVPTLESPSNTLLCISNIIEFKWNVSSNINEDAIKYNIEISKDNQFTTIDKTATVSSTTATFTLEKGVAYYWRVEAIDGQKESSGFSDVFSLYTEGNGVINHLPYAAQLVKPELGAFIVSGTTILQWAGSDADGDALTYDVYFDDNDKATTLVSENQKNKTHNVITNSKKTYYWKVVVKDDKGGKTIGQIWSFSTE